MENLKINDINMMFYHHNKLIDNHTFWVNFFEKLEFFSKMKITYLDKNDPIRNKITNVNEAAEYIQNLNHKESVWWIFGKMGKTKKMDFVISLSANKGEDGTPDKINLSFENINIESEDELNYLNTLFVEIIKVFDPFYAFCDSILYIYDKRKRSGSPINIQCELTGIFWLTYFNKKYSNFLNINKSEVVSQQLNNGTLIKLGKSPGELDFTRYDIEKTIGNTFFVDTTSTFNKPIGKYVLTFSQLGD